MKNTIKTSKKILLTVAMLTAMLGNANETSFNIKDDAKKTALTINNVKEGNLIPVSTPKSGAFPVSKEQLLNVFSKVVTFGVKLNKSKGTMA